MPILASTLAAAVCPCFSGEVPQQVAPQLVAKSLSRAAAKGEANRRFVLLSPSTTGVSFVNQLDWDHPQGMLFDSGFACGGIAVGDVDGNGLPDLFFVRGPGPNRLYLQQAPWQFVEKSAEAGLPGDAQQPLGGDAWGTGAALLDIDNDGDLDLYICNYAAPNALFINRGDATFDERAADYGLDIVDACLMPSVADYDRDGDLDIYIAANRFWEEKQFGRRDLFFWEDGMEYLRPAAEKYFTIRRHFDRPIQLNMWAGRRDRLLRNEGRGRRFTDVSAPLKVDRGDTLSATWWDYDHDGWPDLYVANDLSAPDRLFHNEGNGRFDERSLDALPHLPWMAMGASSGDINNDGLVDFLAADMSFRSHFKDKATMGDMSAKFRQVGYFPHNQLMRNALFVNTGTRHFQEAAHFAGLASTDWTWTAKLADLDNDGHLDAFFTNGSPVNLADSTELASMHVESGVIDTSLLRKRYGQLDPVLEQNLVFQNRGELRFVDRSHAWGLDHVGMSFAAVHADIDRDGDLDLVVANLNQPPSLYRNESQASGILVQLRGLQSNRSGVGAELQLETDSGRQVRQVYPVSGFLSCQEAIVHFGLGVETNIRSLKVLWPSGLEQSFEDLVSGQLYLVEEPTVATDQLATQTRLTPRADPFFLPPAEPLAVEHHELPFDDFARQPLLPNRLSQSGPPLAWGDVDGDGDDDLFVGEGTDWMGMVYLNQGDFQFKPQPQQALALDAAAEDTAALFLDANGDGHLDLYVASGGVECHAGDARLRDRLYWGDGTGDFQPDKENWLPDLRISSGAVAANDFDQDGDVDLIVGGRSIPGEYPLAPQHALLRNDGDEFVDVLDIVAPELAGAGMITAATWVDVDNDSWDDLLLAIDWGPVRLFLNQQGKLVDASNRAGLSAWTGWWRSLACGDLDNDGDTDFVAGNFGLNTKYRATRTNPVLAYYGEFGDSERRHLIEALYEGDQLFPLRGKSCSSSAMPHLTSRFPTYAQFAKATLSEIYTADCLQRADRFEVNSLASACFLNDGSGHFTRVPLPTAVQLAPVFGLAFTEVNGDDFLDLAVAQNFFGPQRETGPHNGGVGVIAIGRGDGTFEPLRADHSGMVVVGDAKSVATHDWDGDGWRDLCVATNNGPIHWFRHRGFDPMPTPDRQQSPVHNGWIRNNLDLAQRFIDSDQSEQGLPYLRRALKVSPLDSESLLMLAVIRGDQQRFAEANALLDRLRDQGVVEELRLQTESGRLLTLMKQFDRAAERLSQVIARQPHNRRAQLFLGDARRKQGRLAEARKHYRIARRPDRIAEVDERVEIAQRFFEQAIRLQRHGDDATALQLYQQAQLLNSQHPQLIKALASLLANTAEQQLRDPWLAKRLAQQAAHSIDDTGE